MSTATATPAAAPAVTATAAAKGAAAASTKLAGDMKTFLKMLTTQLQNQDPTSPMDTNQMTQQLVQLSSVEQQISMNGNLERLIGLQQAAQLTAAAPLMGGSVEVESERLSLQGGRAALTLPKAGAATRAMVTVSDAAGRVLRQETVALGAAASTWTWDGRDSTGVRRADGAYGVTVTGAAEDGAAVPLAFGVLARATAAERSEEGLQLTMGGLSVAFEKLRKVAAGLD